jgi:SAM-dependent methyltransferase
MKSNRDVCAVCGWGDLHEIVNLGMHPLADTFVPLERLYQGDRAYPLICDLCVKCGQIQSRAVTDPEERYSYVDYSYTSSNSSFSRNHWVAYARDISQAVQLERGARVVEIGSNDGYLSKQFNELGYRAFGIDPSSVMCELATRNGVEVSCGLFSKATAENHYEMHGAAPLIVANNVVNHANDPLDFARGIAKLLAPGGTFVFELPYWMRTILEGKFDQIYHEHVTYFTVRLARSLFDAVGMMVIRAEEVDYHGGSIRLYVRHAGKDDGSVAALIAAEEQAGLFAIDTYKVFMSSLRKRRDLFLKKIFDLRSGGASLVCVGAAAKANTFLNFYKLDATIVDWVTDSSTSKQGKFTPLTRIPIIGDDILKEYSKVFVIITSWNLAGFLLPILLAINPEIQLLNPFEDS